jgi:recA bacterial DNA recombination protein
LGSSGRTSLALSLLAEASIDSACAYIDVNDSIDPRSAAAAGVCLRNVDAVEEIRSSSGWMPAEIGRGATGFTNIITWSGSSGFHGSVFAFVRNSAFDARNYFDLDLSR